MDRVCAHRWLEVFEGLDSISCEGLLSWLEEDLQVGYLWSGEFGLSFGDLVSFISQKF